MKNCINIFLLFSFSFLLLTSCNKINVFEKNTTIPQYEWQYSYAPTFQFDITDTTSNYSVYLILRHTDAYRYNNIWLKIGLQAPADSMRFIQSEFVLGDDSKGWHGTGMDDIWQVREPISNGPQQYFTFKKQGVYKFSIAQAMRENPLKNIMDVGIRVEKIKRD